MKQFINFGPLYLPDSFECFGTSWTAGRWTASGRAKPFVERNRNYNNNANINRNVNVNHNVNVNRNVNVNVHGGCYNCGQYHDDSWNWGSFAAGTAVRVATTAAVAAATRPPSTTVVVQAPALGTVVPTLPGGCATMSATGAMIYQCSNVYYRPYCQGTQLVYQVVTYP